MRFLKAIALILLVFLSGCSKTIYVPVESVKTEYKNINRTDSIYIRDSVIIREKGDTVYETRWRTEYRDRQKTDSIFITDSIQVPYPVERSLSKWQQIKMDIGGIAMGVVLGLLFIIIVIVKRKMF